MEGTKASGLSVLTIVKIITIIIYCNALELFPFGRYEFGKCPLEESKFRTLNKLSIRDCVRGCAVRPVCAAIGYNRHSKTCSLYSSAGNVTNPHCVQVKMETVNITKFTGNCKCNDWEVCNVDTGKCEYDLRLCEVANDTCVRGAYKFGHCYNSTSVSYKGKLSKSREGYTCQRWDQQYPHKHSFSDDIHKFPDATYSEAGNYCRDPDGTGYVWCYTTNPHVRWTSCAVYKCNPDYDPYKCYRFDEAPRAYKGNNNRTVSGYPCQFWDLQFPHTHSFTDDNLFPEKNITEARNYCRDVDGSGFPWCYTTYEFKTRQICDIAVCNTHS